MRAALYSRVSSKEQLEGYSIDAQKRAFRVLCQGRGWESVAEYIDEGKSARTDKIGKRPAFREAIADAQAHAFDVLVVHKIDRFSRNLRIALESFDVLGKAGVSFVSITEQMDFTTPYGKFALTMLGGLAQLYSDNLSFETRKGKGERKEQGLYNGPLPFGVMKGPDDLPKPHDELWVIRDEKGTIVRERAPVHEGLKLAFELAAQGKTDKSIAQVLNARGYRTWGTHGQNPFSKDTVGGVLQNRFYVGELPDGKGGWVKGKHATIIPSELFGAAQQARARRRTVPRGPEVTPIVTLYLVLPIVPLVVAISGCSPRSGCCVIRGLTETVVASRVPDYRSWIARCRPTFKPSSCRRTTERRCWHIAEGWTLK